MLSSYLELERGAGKLMMIDVGPASIVYSMYCYSSV